MNADENEIYDFLRRFPGSYLSVVEISRSVGSRRRFNDDRLWAKPILRRMEAEGWLEANVFGEFRLKRHKEDDTRFLEAIRRPGFSLGDTAIICLGEASKPDSQEEGSAPKLASEGSPSG